MRKDKKSHSFDRLNSELSVNLNSNEKNLSNKIKRKMKQNEKIKKTFEMEKTFEIKKKLLK